MIIAYLTHNDYYTTLYTMISKNTSHMISTLSNTWKLLYITHHDHHTTRLSPTISMIRCPQTQHFSAVCWKPEYWKKWKQNISTQLHSYLCIQRFTMSLQCMHHFFLGFPMYSGGITWIHVYICVSGGWGGIGVSAGIFPLYIIISVICYPCLATCTYTSLFLVIIHQQKHQCLQIPGIWCIKCVPIHHMFSC